MTIRSRCSWQMAVLLALGQGAVVALALDGEQDIARSRLLLQSNTTGRYQKPYNVCISEWTPMVKCVGLPPRQYSGYAVALWRIIAQDLGWADAEWSFTCIDGGAMLDDLSDTAGLCSFSPAGVFWQRPQHAALLGCCNNVVRALATQNYEFEIVQWLWFCAGVEFNLDNIKAGLRCASIAAISQHC
eukprot:GHRR01030420.1.p1 GENE.GHRR01030420.1~~GHRR01030420.1.p1  ORF type:complete len:187 (+),score=34.91 GHRR01030420.1:117-677(+)